MSIVVLRSGLSFRWLLGGLWFGRLGVVGCPLLFVGCWCGADYWCGAGSGYSDAPMSWFSLGHLGGWCLCCISTGGG